MLSEITGLQCKTPKIDRYSTGATGWLLTKRETGVTLNPHLASVCPGRERWQDVSLGQKLHNKMV